MAHVQVQGEAAPDQIIRALRYFNGRETGADIIVIIRGGGSADDLSAFNDELLVREIAGSRIPTVVGVGHEIDESLADLAADVRAATPSNAAQLVVPDRSEMIRATRGRVQSLLPRMDRIIIQQRSQLQVTVESILSMIEGRVQQYSDELAHTKRVMAELDPSRVLERGYAILRGSHNVGETIAIETKHDIIKAEVQHVSKK